MIKLEIILEEEQIRDCFENVEVKFTKKKMKDLLENVDYSDLDIKEQLEERLIELVEEMIQEEYGE